MSDSLHASEADTSLLTIAVCRGVLSGTICIVSAFAVGLCEVFAGRGFGGSDLLPFLIWTIPLGLLVACSKALLLRWRLKISSIFGFLADLGSGLTLGLVWSFVSRWWLGDWYLLWSVSPALCWMTGGGVGMLSLRSSLSDTRTKTARLVGSGLFFGFAVLLAGNVFQTSEPPLENFPKELRDDVGGETDGWNNYALLQ